MLIVEKNIKAEFIFHNVGQGLFYSGRINEKFNFVYDCGSENFKYLKLAINRYLNFYKNNIDMLVISHLHKDHINGLDYLLRHKKTNICFLPYLTETERLFVLAKIFLLQKKMSGI